MPSPNRANQLLDHTQRMIQERGFKAFSYKDLAAEKGALIIDSGPLPGQVDGNPQALPMRTSNARLGFDLSFGCYRGQTNRL